MLAGTRTLDQRVERQHFHLAGDVLNTLRLVAGDLVDLSRQTGGQQRNIGPFIAIG